MLLTLASPCFAQQPNGGKGSEIASLDQAIEMGRKRSRFLAEDPVTSDRINNSDALVASVDQYEKTCQADSYSAMHRLSRTRGSRREIAGR